MDGPIEVGGVRWWLPAGASRAQARERIGRALAAVAAGAPDLKHGRRKGLYRLDLSAHGEADHLLKVNRYGGRLRGRSKARHELALAEAAAARGLPTPLPLAAGERRSAGRLEACYLIVPLLSGAVDLRERLAVETRPSARRALAAALGSLARRLHDGGLHQDDFQPNNFLVREVGSGPELFVIDFERARLRRRVPARLRRRALAKLDRELGRAPASLRLRFLRAYCGGDAREARRIWAAVVREAPRLARRDAGHLYRNAARPGRRFASARLPGWVGLARRDLAPARLARAAALASQKGPGRGPRILAAPAADEWCLVLSRSGVRHARRTLARALVLAARGLAPEPLAVLCGAEESLLVLDRAPQALQASEVRRNAALEAAWRVLERRLDGYGRRSRALSPPEVAVAPLGVGSVRASLLSVEAFGLRPRFGGPAGSAARSR